MLAKKGTTKTIQDEPDLNIDPKFNLTGAQLSELTQALAYTGICKQKFLKYKRGLDMMLDITQYTTEDALASHPQTKNLDINTK